MNSGEIQNVDARIEVRFSGLGCGVIAIVLALFPGLLATVPGSGLQLGFAAAFGALIAYGLFLVVTTFTHANPIMILAPEGIYLPVAGDAFLTYDRVEVWAERLGTRGIAPWAFSLQGRPRVWLEVPWWARIRMVRVNTTVGGDLYLDERFISIGARKLAAAIEARRVAFT